MARQSETNSTALGGLINPGLTLLEMEMVIFKIHDWVAIDFTVDSEDFGHENSEGFILPLRLLAFQSLCLLPYAQIKMCILLLVKKRAIMIIMSTLTPYIRHLHLLLLPRSFPLLSLQYR